MPLLVELIFGSFLEARKAADVDIGLLKYSSGYISVSFVYFCQYGSGRVSSPGNGLAPYIYFECLVPKLYCGGAVFVSV